jgi:hypothetical protein
MIACACASPGTQLTALQEHKLPNMADQPWAGDNVSLPQRSGLRGSSFRLCDRLEGSMMTGSEIGKTGDI